MSAEMPDVFACVSLCFSHASVTATMSTCYIYREGGSFRIDRANIHRPNFNSAI